MATATEESRLRSCQKVELNFALGIRCHVGAQFNGLSHIFVNIFHSFRIGQDTIGQQCAYCRPATVRQRVVVHIKSNLLLFELPPGRLKKCPSTIVCRVEVSPDKSLPSKG